MPVLVYTTSVSCNKSLSKQQWQILEFLRVKNIEYEEIDLSVNTDARSIMLKKMPENKKENALPPQVFNEDVYCGDYEAFFNAQEMRCLYTFFKLTPPENSYEERQIKKYKSQGIELKF